MPNQESALGQYALPIAAVAIIVLAIGGWFLYQNTGGNAQATEELGQQFEWRLTPEETAQGTQTTVVLRIADVDVPVGIVPGTCKQIDGTEVTLLPGELSGIICQSGEGPGREIGVFAEGGGLVLKLGEVNGTERTNFQQITGEIS